LFPLGCPLQHVLEPLPVLVVPLLQIVLAVLAAGEGIQLESLVRAVAHGVADVVAARGPQLIQVLFEVGKLEEVVVLGASDQQHGLALVLPVAGVVFPRLNAVGAGVGLDDREG